MTEMLNKFLLIKGRIASIQTDHVGSLFNIENSDLKESHKSQITN